MRSPSCPSNDSPENGSTRRALLRTLALSPVAVAAVAEPSWSKTLAALHASYDEAPVTLLRTREGRNLSRVRFYRAEEFMPARLPKSRSGWHHFLYSAGIAAQLGLSSHLLDVGFPDNWNARHIGLRVAKSLAYANATGLGHDCPDMARLALVLTPYCQWNRPRLFGEREPDDDGFTPDRVQALLRALLDRVHEVTGHPRPDDWDRDRRAAET